MSADLLSYGIYALFALGGLAVFFALPQEGRWPARTGAVLGLAALAGLLTLPAARYALPATAQSWFYLCAAVALFAAARVITHTRPVYSVIYFVLVVVAVAGLALLQAAEFLAVALIIIYAGAIMVTYVFVLMLAQAGDRALYDNQSHGPVGGVIAGFVLTALITGMIGQFPTEPPPAPLTAVAATAGADLPPGNTAALGSLLLGRYVLPLQIGAILLLIAMVGAVAISRRPIPADEAAAMRGGPEPELGQTGREVAPFHDFRRPDHRRAKQETTRL